MTLIRIRGGPSYKVLNQLGTNLGGFEEKQFTPTERFIEDLQSMYDVLFSEISPYPYWRMNMGNSIKLLTQPLDNNIEYTGIVPIPRDDIFLSTNFRTRDVRNEEDFGIGIEEILLTHHKDWQEKRRRTGRIGKK